MTTKIVPDPQDLDAAAANTPRNEGETAEQYFARIYRLAIATKLIRLYEQGRSPLQLIREMDRIREEQKDR